MGLFNKLFGTESVIYWRLRAKSAERKIVLLEESNETERERHRIREELFLDELLKAAGRKPIRTETERVLDADGAEKEKQKQLKTKIENAQLERERIERNAFIESSVKAGKSEEEAAAYFDENKSEILKQTQL